ncbi:carbohydrate kinase family protein [Jannaschia sp. S6380]|uniref:carbohydrate kinase family protein n=1 Tax=Jannaschia sp. S6380 TaxID=2926408 RepID=UPI001FF324B7|nr:carbohydrate kinase family protein [Jannaschia sp. S6380]MCK0168191.1 carbohydrate kinase family protein [Jannaschia sp. S6380]
MDADATARLLCVGDIDMDLIVRVPAPPSRDGKVDGRRIAQTPGGMAANVAVAARRLGTRTRLLGAVGDDALGREALAALTSEGLDLSHVATRHGEATFFCVILVDDEGEKSLVKVMSPAFLPRADEIMAAAFAGVAHVHLTVARADPGLAVAAMARAAGATLSLDLEAADLPADLPQGGGALADLLASVDLLFVSDRSRAAVEPVLGPLTSEGRAVITTRGRQGAMLERSGTRTQIPGHRVPVTDTSGAGDAFAGAFLSAMLDGADDATALCRANAAAALSTRAYGAQAGAPTAAEMAAFLDVDGVRDA